MVVPMDLWLFTIEWDNMCRFFYWITVEYKTLWGSACKRVAQIIMNFQHVWTGDKKTEDTPEDLRANILRTDLVGSFFHWLHIFVGSLDLTISLGMFGCLWDKFTANAYLIAFSAYNMITMLLHNDFYFYLWKRRITLGLRIITMHTTIY